MFQRIYIRRLDINKYEDYKLFNLPWLLLFIDLMLQKNVTTMGRWIGLETLRTRGMEEMGGKEIHN